MNNLHSDNTSTCFSTMLEFGLVLSTNSTEIKYIYTLFHNLVLFLLNLRSNLLTNYLINYAYPNLYEEMRDSFHLIFATSHCLNN